jgi:hypothetical protein
VTSGFTSQSSDTGSQTSVALTVPDQAQLAELERLDAVGPLRDPAGDDDMPRVEKGELLLNRLGGGFGVDVHSHAGEIGTETRFHEPSGRRIQGPGDVPGSRITEGLMEPELQTAPIKAVEMAMLCGARTMSGARCMCRTASP